MLRPIDVIGKTSFEKAVLESDVPVLVDFWAPWCVPCQMMAPVLEDIAKEYEGKLRVVKINTEETENQGLAQLFGIRSIPNLKLFKGGKVVRDFIGFRPKNIFVGEIEAELTKGN